MLLHGLAGSSTAWLDVVAPLTGLGPVVAPDLPGSVFGETETHRPRQARLAATVAFLPQLTAALGLGRLSVHGLSMGALGGLRFAAVHPATVEQPVLVNPLLPAPMSVMLSMRPRPHTCGWSTWRRPAQ